MQDTHIVITGASSGIGAAAALISARSGTRLSLLARTRTALEGVAAQACALGAQATAYPVDLTDAAAVAATATALLAAAGPPDIFLSNAGSGRWLTSDETTPAEVVSLMAMPYFAAFYLTRALLPAMLQRNSGRLVYVNSPAALVAWPGATGYTAARWALRGFAEALRADLHGTRVCVSTVILGQVSSGYYAHNPGVAERIPGLARLLLPPITPHHAAAAILRGIQRGDELILAPPMLHALYLLNALAPGLIRWLTRTTGWRRK
ncbi:MAG TPA: SDR family NAD(P)-dependent oxidoreductase [Roseiflexaceae bacterium]|nr:SDR family NAD(P)-dependent oxidoreductase [Roseiflexaceae bacterium]HMP40640.1 SDR family NAD(P)-dependent oxidoreductase [Roseiflexaceae bacterium]